MKKTILILLITTLLIPTMANAKVKQPQTYYTVTGTVHNFTYTMHYKDGKNLKGDGFDIYIKDGCIYQMVDTDTDLHFKEGAKVKVKFYNNGTYADKTDDIIVSVKKIKKRNK